MNKTQLFEFLETYNPSALRSLLSSAYDAMGHDQRQAVFGRLVRARPPAQVDGKGLMGEVAEFRRESLAGKYYAPFEINSKNYMQIPEATKEWLARLGDLLQACLLYTSPSPRD